MSNLRLDVQITGAKDLLKLQHFLDPKLMAKAQRGGITYAAKAAKVAVAKEVRGRYNIPSARIKQDVTGPRFGPGGVSATLYLSRKPPSALSYGGRDTGRGLTMKITRGGRAQRVQRGFIVKSGKLAGLPFRRLTNERDSRIGFVSGPSVGSLFAGQADSASVMQAAVQARINEQFIKGMQRVLDSAARGYGK
jgi:hypothetical protein